MQENNRNMSKIITTLFIALFGFSSFSAIEASGDILTTTNIQQYAVLESFESKYFDMQVTGWQSDFTNVNSKTRLTLGYYPDHLIASNQTTTLNLKIETWSHNGSAFVANAIVYKDLEINYDTDGSLVVTDLSSYIIEDSYRMLVTVDGVTGPVDDVYLKIDYETERYYSMSTSAITNYGFDNVNNVLPSGLQENEIKFWWEEVIGAEAYDLEWTFISDYDYSLLASAVTAEDIADLEFDFYMNSTRVRISDNKYLIPRVFNRGYIVYRVRPIGKQGVNFEYPLEGAWTFVESGTVEDFNNDINADLITISSDHEADNNWAHTVQYLDNGRRLEQIVFFDGLGRLRQALSRNPVTNQMIVNNSYYDQIGREIISDLSTPTEGESFEFREDFNYIDNGTVVAPYEPDLYLAAQITTCDYTPWAMSTALGHGAGNYYSSLNPDVDEDNANIPDAGGYPFRTSRYVSDPTGRLREIGKAGLEHQTGRNSSRLMYETATQLELNALFGTEVGVNTHYQKSYNIDPNGQAYLRYTDMSGRLVAKALSGNSPAGMDALQDNTGSTPKTEIIYDNPALDTDLSLEIASFTYSHVVTDESTTLIISHDFDPTVFEDPTCLAGICFDCHYDFEIEIIRTDCPQPSAIYSYTETINGSTIDNICNGAGYAGWSVNFSNNPVSLEVGEYSITKTLKISDGIAELYWCNYIDNTTCGPDYNSIYNDYYDNAQWGCDETPIVLDYNACNLKRELMSMDMAVGGQYGQVYSNAGGIDPSAIANSIYNINNTVFGFIWTDTPPSPYLNSNGTEAHIIVTGSVGNYTPEVQSGATVYVAANGDLWVYPQDLLNIADFVYYFEPSWGDELVEYHPEYCYLKFCEDHSGNFYDFENAFNEIETFDEACLNGYFAPLGTTTLAPTNIFGTPCTTVPTIEDEFFTTGYFTGNIAQWALDNYGCVPEMTYGANSNMTEFYLLDDGVNYLTIWEYAVWKTVCPQSTLNVDIQSCITGASLDVCTKDLIWLNFKSAYQQMRQRTFLFAQDAYVSFPANLIGGGCGLSTNNECIGYDQFSGFSSVRCFDPYKHFDATFLDLVAGPVTPVLADATGPCSSANASAFEFNDPRFGSFYVEDLTYPPGAVTNIQQYITDQIEDICLQSCEAQANDWMASLVDCGLTAQQIIDIRTGLIEVCATGCDLQNMQGASDLTNAPITVSPSGYTSFEDVLFTILGSNYETALCSDLLIDYPSPYGQNLIQSMNSPVDECACNMVLQAEYDLANNPVSGVSTVAEMLMYTEGISYANAQVLACSCNSAFTGTWTPTSTWDAASLQILADAAILVPNGMTCTPNTCQSCTQIETLKAAFLVDFPGVETHVNYEQLFKNYLNIDLGYNLSFSEYEVFLEACDALSTDPVCSLTNAASFFTSMIDVLARRGQLTSTLVVDLNDNVVYEFSNIGSLFQGWEYKTTTNLNTLSMTVGDAEVDLVLPAGADFDFDDILAIDYMVPVPCGADDAFELHVKIMVCGQIETRVLTGSSPDLDLVTCYCGTTEPELCNSTTGLYMGDNCYIDELIAINHLSLEDYQDQLDDLHDQFIIDYTAQCALAFDSEVIEETKDVNDYQHTLFYYDLAGNLVQTVSPGGVQLDFASTVGFPDVDADRNLQTTNVPTHEFKTEYSYNSYNQTVGKTNPDQDGDTRYWYDRYGRIAASQNPVQEAENKYSYAIYDENGRYSQAGQVVRTTPPPETSLKLDDLAATFEIWVMAGTRSEVTITTYNAPLSATIASKFKTGTQDNLRLYVATIAYFKTVDATTVLTTDYESAIHYSYGDNGNIVEQLQDVPMMSPVNLDIKSTQYESNPMVGTLDKIIYQEGELDYISQSYHYDDLNRMTEVLTTTDDVHKTREVHYGYNDVGGLVRKEIGKDKVQGMDFTSTINGWVKGMNSSVLSSVHDMGNDGTIGFSTSNQGVHENVAKDIVAYTIGYFDGDYTAIGSSTMEASYSLTPLDAQTTDLYNGNIRNVVTSIYGMAIETVGSTYKYDQLNRLTEMTAFKNPNGINDWAGILSTTDYYNSYSYDRNGNIESLKRHGIGAAFDKMEYQYTASTNQLTHVVDNASIDGTMGDITNMAGVNYKYDAIGELEEDYSEGILKIHWRRGDKKILRIERNDAASSELEFVYNPFGLRVVKIEKPRISGIIQPSSGWIYTYYSYNSSGAVVAIYNAEMDGSIETANLRELNILGASRIGQISLDKLLWQNGLPTPGSTNQFDNSIGQRKYEIGNYLGNVLAVVNDRKILSTPGSGTIFEAVVLMTSDYYPFGMVMPGRSTSTTDYRYAFNGMEVDPEVSGNGNSYTTEFRQYNPRLARWASLDPLMGKFPHISPYVAYENNPIIYVDPYGLNVFLPDEPVKVTRKGDSKYFFNGHKEIEDVLPKSAPKGSIFEFLLTGEGPKGKHDVGDVVSVTYVFTSEEKGWHKTESYKGYSSAESDVKGGADGFGSIMEVIGTGAEITTIPVEGGLNPSGIPATSGTKKKVAPKVKAEVPVVKVVETVKNNVKEFVDENKSTVSLATTVVDKAADLAEKEVVDEITKVKKAGGGVKGLTGQAKYLARMKAIANKANVAIVIYDGLCHVSDAYEAWENDDYGGAAESTAKAAGTGIVYYGSIYAAAQVGAMCGAWGGPVGIIVGVGIGVAWSYISSWDWGW